MNRIDYPKPFHKYPLLAFYTNDKKHWPGLALVILMSLISGILNTFSSTLWGQAVDFGIAGDIRNMLYSASIVTLLILMDCVRTALHYFIIGLVTESMFKDIRITALKKIICGDFSVIENDFRAGDMATRINTDIDILNNFLAGNVSDYTRQIFKAIFAVIASLFVSWQLAIVFFILLPISTYIAKKVSAPIQFQNRQAMNFTGRAVNIATESLNGLLTIKAFNLEKYMEEKFDKEVTAACIQSITSEKAATKMTAIKYIMNVVQTMSLFLGGICLVLLGFLSVGQMISFIALSGYVNEAFSHIDAMLRHTRNASATAQRLFEVMDIPSERYGKASNKLSEKPCMSKDLCFSYSDVTILDGVNIEVPVKKKIAIVGSSGCGKSTILKLICRLYLPGDGILSLFGVDTKKWNPSALRKQISLVSQDSILFDGSVFENISYGNPNLSREECENALKTVGLWELVSSFPDGIDHNIGESGMQLSGGQRQRICIARAIVKDANLLLLDEPTSALDPKTEKDLLYILDEILEDRSAVIVAHRLSTVRNVDYVYCMDKGKVVEEGEPDDLIEKKGIYFTMCKLQGLV